MPERRILAVRHAGPRTPLRRGGWLAVSALAAVVAMPATPAGAAAPPAAGVAITRVEPSSTGAGITPETDTARHHLVAEHRGNGRRRRDHHLVVMLGGSNVGVGGYSEVIAHAAGLGHPVVGLSYPNRGTIGSACQPTGDADRCFAKARGEIVFGADVPDPNGDTYSSDHVSVDAANSISGRLIALLDALAVEDRFWGRYLVDDETSPYTARHRGSVRLDHEQLVLAGHSQGGGHAAFWAMSTRVERVVMLGSPDDTTMSGTAPWVGGASQTPLDRYWGIRHEAEGPYGQHVGQVWSELGGAGAGAGDTTSEVEVGDGSGDPQGSHRLVLVGDQGTPLLNHMSMAYDGSYLAGVPDAWTYLFTGGCDEGPGWSRIRRRP